MADTARLASPDRSAELAATGSLWQVAWRRKGLVALGLLAGLGLGVVVYLRYPPVYQSTAQALVVKKYPDAVTGVNTHFSSPEDDGATHQELMQSTTVIRRAIRLGKLDTLPNLGAGGADLTETIRRGLTVTRPRGLLVRANSLQLSFRGKDPQECQRVLDALLASYQQYLDKKYQSGSRDTLTLVLRERELLQKGLARKEAAYRKFRATSPLLGRGQERLDLSREQFDRIQAKRSVLLLRRVEIEGLLEAVAKARKEGRNRDAVLALITEFTAKSDPQEARRDKQLTLQEQLYPLFIEEQQLLESYGPKHPKVRAVRDRIRAARALLLSPATAWDPKSSKSPADPIDLHVRILRQRLSQIRIAEGLLARLYRKEHAEARKLAVYDIQDESFRTEIAADKKLEEGLIQRLQDVGFIKNTGGYEVQVTAGPAPGQKVVPSAALVLLASLFVGLLGGLGLAYVVEVRDKRFRSPEEVRHHLGMPVVGIIPDGVPADPLRGALHQPSSAEAEAYRGLRNVLCFGSGPRSGSEGGLVIQITSPRGHSGKSILAANLAVAVAQSGRRVLAVDADLRQPRLHELFGLPATPGLGAVIAEEAAPADVVRESGIPNLAVLPCGPLPPNPPALLLAPRFKDLLAALRQQYEFMIVDTPAILDVADAGVVARLVDRVLLTVRLSRDDRPAAERAVGVLAALGAPVAGVVLTGAPPAFGYGPTGRAEPAVPNLGVGTGTTVTNGFHP
jgi:capsular exopolysaccharide synthesis family protein